MKPQIVEVGHTYIAGPRSKPRKVVRSGFWWSRVRHGLVYYVGASGREIEIDEIQFLKWAEDDITKVETY